MNFSRFFFGQVDTRVDERERKGNLSSVRSVYISEEENTNNYAYGVAA